MDEIILIGGGGHCESVIDVIEQESRFKIAGIIDKSEFMGSKIFDYKVIASDDDLEKLAQKYRYAIVTVGQIKSPSLRIKLFDRAERIGFIMPSIISPRAYVSKHAYIGAGSVVMHDVMVNANARIGKNCIINTKSLIEHGSEVGDNCHISTAVCINGGVIIESSCFIGSNATLRDHIVVKSNSFIRAGSLVK